MQLAASERRPDLLALWIWIARSVAAAVLGIIIFVSFLSFLLVNHFSGKLLDSRFYTQIFIEHDAYNRVYDEVLLDPQVRASTRRLTRDLQIITHEDLVDLARELAPPEYLQDQTEANIQRAVEYLRGEADTLDLHLDLGPPLARVKPALLEQIDQRIDALETIEPDPQRSLLEQVAQARDLTEASIRSLGSGAIPEAVPSVRLIPGPFRGDLYDVLMPGLVRDSRLDPRVRSNLEANSLELRDEFIAGDTHQFLKATARVIVEPILDDALARFRQHLDRLDRLDLLAATARSDHQRTEEELRADIAGLRDRVRRAERWGKTVALAVGITATVAMLLIYLPSLTNALRWPGLTLLLTGGVLYILARILESSIAASSFTGMSQLPPSAAELATEITHSLVQRSVEGIAAPALLLVVVGAVLFGGSFLVSLLKPYAPGLR